MHGTMKIALVITALGVGGAETQVINLADSLSARGHDILVISLTGEAVVLPRSAAVRVVSLNVRKTPVSLISGFRRACELIRRFRPDVVHSHMVHANLFARLMRLCAPIPRLICTAHSINEGGGLRMWLYRVTDPLAHLTTNVTQAALDRYLECDAIPAGKALAVGNGIDCSHFRFDVALRLSVREQLEVPADHKVLLAAGRFCDAKDYPTLLKAFAAVAAQQEDCVLWIAGTGDSSARLKIEALIEHLGIGSRVRLLGLRRDIHALMCAADVFVLSSHLEGFPLVVGEAMACELVVVATDAGGVSEWLGSSGYRVPIRDSNALSDALLQALALDAHNRKMQGAMARQRVLAHYSLAAVAQRWERIYRGDTAVTGAEQALIDGKRQIN